jgi:hypothetical protein
VRDTQLQFKLPGVPMAKQGREVESKWAWTEGSVWTERMLATLERGVKGGKWVMAQRLLYEPRTVLAGHSTSDREPTSKENSLTGKPDAGNPPVRFGGRGGAAAPSLPLFRTLNPCGVGKAYVAPMELFMCWLTRFLQISRSYRSFSFGRKSLQPRQGLFGERSNKC